MPVLIKSPNRVIAANLIRAESGISRTVGLLCKSDFQPGQSLLIPECNRVHTFGMQYAIDVVFLDSDNRIVYIIENMKPRRVSRSVKNARSVLELPAGMCEKYGLKDGDLLDLKVDTTHDVRNWLKQEAVHVFANFLLAILYFRFVSVSFSHWRETGSVIPFGLLFVNSLLVYLFLTRRRSQITSKRPVDWFAALGTVFLSLCLNAHQTSHSILLNVSVVIQVLGVIGMLASLVSLGRSFGIIAALRKIKLDGMYSIVRHPLYAAEIIFYIGFVLCNPTPINVLLVIGIIIGQCVRAIAEERILSIETPYQAYLARVRFRFIPGLF
jgi:protein-S-isoprenylcysteine O-methyltransferase Ste14/uncharacterized membrane protein (UPF0127 family)